MNKYKKDLIKFLFEVKYNRIPYNEIVEERDDREISRMINNMLELLEMEVTDFSFENGKDVTYLFVLLDLLPVLARNDNGAKKNAVRVLKSVHRQMKGLIYERPSNMDKISQSKYNVLKNLISKVEDISLNFYINLPKDYDSSKEEYISYLIFKSKNFSFYNLAISKFPYIVNYRDKDGIPLLDRVIDAYLKALDLYLSDINLGPMDDLMYFNKIVKSIMENPKLKMENEDRERLLNKIKEYLATKHYESNRQNEKLTYFTNNLFFLLTDRKVQTTEKDLNYEYEVHPEFKAANHSEARRIYVLHKNLIGPPTERKIYTFDGEGAFELDDAVSLVREDGLLKLKVYLANPPFYIPEDSIVRTEARRRNRSLYYGNQCNPIYDMLLSRDLISLNTSGYKNVICFSMDFDELSGDLVHFSIDRENVKIYKNLTYNDFDQTIRCRLDDEFSNFLRDLCQVSAFMRRDIHETEEYKSLHSDDSKHVSTSVISTIMLYTGIKAAEYMAERRYPYIYRCHHIDDEAITEINALKERMLLYSDTEIAHYLEQLKHIYPKAYYSTTNVGHMGLGVDHASHITSGLRRYADDGNLDSFNKFLFSAHTKDDILRYEDELARIAEEMNSRRNTLDDYEFEMTRVLRMRKKSQKNKYHRQYKP